MNQRYVDLELKMAKMVTNGSAVVLSLTFLRDGARDLALEILERKLDLGKVRQARDHLMRRQRPLALELLETELDRHIVALGELAGRLKPQDHEIVIEKLRSIRDYRRANPRRYEADLGNFDEESFATTRLLWDKAEKVLHEIS